MLVMDGTTAVRSASGSTHLPYARPAVDQMVRSFRPDHPSGAAVIPRA